MSRSILLDGILSENADAARVHDWTFDHASVLAEAQWRIFRANEAAPKDPFRPARDDDLVLPCALDLIQKDRYCSGNPY